ncbi:MAG: hypothetical protein E7077_06145 [Bacteroidales bacterium]|nr:hypothetical protein [Bacteroidales bacterium]
MEVRKRINLSVDVDTYSRLSRFAKSRRYKNECELVMSMINVMLDCLVPIEKKRFDIPEDDAMYINEMFAQMSYSATKQADGDGGVAITRRNKKNNV